MANRSNQKWRHGFLAVLILGMCSAGALRVLGQVATSNPSANQPSAAESNFPTKPQNLETLAGKPTIFVSPLGSDDNQGTAAGQAFKTIGKALSVVGPGDVVLLEDGIYAESLRPKVSGTEDKPIILMGKTPSVSIESPRDDVHAIKGEAIIDATHLDYAISLDRVTHYIIKNLTVRGHQEKAAMQANNASIRVGPDNRCEQVISEQGYGCGFGIMGDNVILYKCTMQDNGLLGAGVGKRSAHVIIDSCIVRGNSKGIKDPAWKTHGDVIQMDGLYYAKDGWENGGLKLCKLMDSVVSGNTINNNVGAGLWFDIDCNNVRVSGNHIYSNHATGGPTKRSPGIAIEISGNMLVEDNIVDDNIGTGLNVWESHDLIIRHNRTNGIYVRAASDRKDQWPKNITIEENQFVGTPPQTAYFNSDHLTKDYLQANGFVIRNNQWANHRLAGSIPGMRTMNLAQWGELGFN